LSWTNVVKVLGISRSTLYRRLEEEGISHETRYSDMSDSDLDSLVREIKRAHPNDGERLMIGHLSRYGVTVPRARLRGSIHRVDPVGTRMRRSVTIRRRVCGVINTVKSLYNNELPTVCYNGKI